MTGYTHAQPGDKKTEVQLHALRSLLKIQQFKIHGARYQCAVGRSSDARKTVPGLARLEPKPCPRRGPTDVRAPPGARLHTSPGRPSHIPASDAQVCPPLLPRCRSRVTGVFEPILNCLTGVARWSRWSARLPALRSLVVGDELPQLGDDFVHCLGAVDLIA